MVTLKLYFKDDGQFVSLVSASLLISVTSISEVVPLIIQHPLCFKVHLSL